MYLGHIQLMIVGSFFGTAVGLVAGYFVDLRKREKEAVEQICSFVTQLRETVKFNVDRSNHMRQILDDNKVPNFLYDTGPIQSLIFAFGHLVRQDSQFEKWNWVRYKMAHVNNSISSFIPSQAALAGLKELHRQCHDELTAVHDELTSRSCACSN